MRCHKKIIVLALVALFSSDIARAQVVISEIMYDLPGTDTGREWVEIQNTGGSEVTIATSTWKFFEANTNHGLSLSQGSLTLSAGGFAIIADNPQKFLLDWPGFSGTIFDSAFSLSNTGEALALKSDATTISDQFTFSVDLGASDDGNSLQKVNGVWKALAPTPGAVNVDGVSVAPQGGSSGTASSTEENTSEESSQEGKTNWPVDPQIFARIVGPSTAIAGADTLLRAEALGLEKKPLDNARYMWNFGDGATKEGETVSHAYTFPGDYVVILDVASGKYSATSRLKLKVVAADISISSVAPGAEGRIEITNNSTQELDVSWWRVRSGNQFFTIPKNTVILARAKLPFSAMVMGMTIDSRDVSLLYPNGSTAYRFDAEAQKPAQTVAPAPKPTVAATAKKSVPVVPPVSTSTNQVASTTAEMVSTTTPIVLEHMQVAAVAETLAPSQREERTPGTSRSSLWLYGVGGVIILGLGVALLSKPKKPSTPPNPSADEYTIIE